MKPDVISDDDMNHVDIPELIVPADLRRATDIVIKHIWDSGILPNNLLFRGIEKRNVAKVLRDGHDTMEAQVNCVPYDLLTPGRFNPVRYAFGEDDRDQGAIVMYHSVRMQHILGFTYRLKDPKLAAMCHIVKVRRA